jgi:hypothetical protein
MNIKNAIKMFVVTNLCLLTLTAAGLQTEKSIETYRKNYTSLVSKWKKEKDVEKKKILRQQIEQLKENNVHLFKK